MATYLAASLSPTDVQAAMNLAGTNDTVELPAGSIGWTSGVVWTAPEGVTLMGAGTAATGGGDQTVITDNIASGTTLINISVSSSGTFRMTGITVQSGTGATKDNGTIKISGPGTVRLDHLHLNMTTAANYKAIFVGTGIRGVLDHSILDFTALDGLYVYNGRSGIGEAQGNYEWSQPTAFGTNDFFFIEDNIVNGSVASGAASTRIFDGYTGAKVVVRFNSLAQSCVSETHATGHAPNDRGLRAQEAYGNDCISDLVADEPNFNLVGFGNGAGLVWGNSADQVYKSMFRFNVTRKNNDTYNQTATPAGWGYAGTAFNGVGSDWDGGTALGTDTALGYPCLDQCGRGQGDLLTGNFPTKINDSTGTLYWPNQALEPIYFWSNVGTYIPGWGGAYYSDNTLGRVVANRDYYPQATGIQTSPTSPFDGTSGVGWGTLANRPTTCTAGVSYFATDQGSWNESTVNAYGVQQNGANGVLYKATATDTWTLYYTPYTYPHPLQGVVPPTAPSLLTATATSSSAISLAWNDNSSDETGFKIERSTDGVLFTQIATVGAGVESYDSTGLPSVTLFYYRVRAYNSLSNSTYSNTDSDTTEAVPLGVATALGISPMLMFL